MRQETPADQTAPMITVRGMGKSFKDFKALQDITLDVNRSEVLCLIGPSGSGKSTLLRCLNFLEAYDQGEVRLEGELIGWQEGTGTGSRRTVPAGQLRRQRQHIGMVFQQFNLWPHLTALENVAEALMQVKRMPKARAHEAARAALAKVHLAEKADSHPANLSGGQQQRVAIARALVTEPVILMADEPTGNLDSKTGAQILKLFEELHTKGMTIIMVTHDDDIAEHCERIVRLRDGVLESDVLTERGKRRAAQQG